MILYQDRSTEDTPSLNASLVRNNISSGNNQGSPTTRGGYKLPQGTINVVGSVTNASNKYDVNPGGWPWKFMTVMDLLSGVQLIYCNLDAEA